MLFVCEPNINRCNIIIFPIIYYNIIGVCEIIEKVKFSGTIIIIVYLIEFSLFMYEYLNTDYNEYWAFQDNVKEIVEYTEELDLLP